MHASFRIALIITAAAIAPAFAAGGNLMGPSNAPRGKVTVTAAPRGVVLRVEATGLTPGWHGLHFHEKGDCSDAKFEKAGAHVHGGSAPVHGLLNPASNDSGDLPNILAGADGTATAELYSTLVMLKPDGTRPGLLDADGAALVIHANADDHRSQPIGGAGERIACAVIR